MTLVEQSEASQPSPVRQVPAQLETGFGSTSGATDGDSGHRPESRLPTTTPAPAPVAGPPSWSQIPPGLVRPRNSGVRVVSSLITALTPAVRASLAASAAVSRAAKPLKVTE